MVRDVSVSLFFGLELLHVDRLQRLAARLRYGYTECELCILVRDSGILPSIVMAHIRNNRSIDIDIITTIQGIVHPESKLMRYSTKIQDHLRRRTNIPHRRMDKHALKHTRRHPQTSPPQGQPSPPHHQRTHRIAIPRLQVLHQILPHSNHAPKLRFPRFPS